jgi:hypothetical protein
MNPDQVLTLLVSGIITSVFSAVGIYIGFTKSSAKTIDIALDKIEKRTKNSPTVKRAKQMMELTDKIFGDEQLIEKATKFFEEATAQISSPEAKNLFKNAAEALKSFTKQPETPMPPPSDGKL